MLQRGILMSQTNRESDSPPPAGSSAGAADLRAAFAAALYAAAPDAELRGFDAAARARLADLAFSIFATRPAGEHRLHVATDEIIEGQRRTFLIIAQSDMPFLVNGATAVVLAERLQVRRLIHPVLDARRDADGRLLALGAGGEPESLIVMEVDQASPQRQQALRQQLDQVCLDARRILADRQPMLDRLQAAIDSLRQNPPAGAPAGISEEIEFLRWLRADNFIFAGCATADGRLGILADSPAALLADDSSTQPLVIGSSPAYSTIHRRIPLRTIAIRSYDADGQVSGMTQFVGLFTVSALRSSPHNVPLVREKAADIIRHFAFADNSHNARVLADVIETFPREELFDADVGELVELTAGLLSLFDRPRARLFLRQKGDVARASVLACIPRALYSTETMIEIGDMLARETAGRLGWSGVEINRLGPACLRYVLEDVRGPLSVDKLNAELVELTRDWTNEVEAALIEAAGPARAAELIQIFGRSFPAGYRSTILPEEAARDILNIAGISQTDGTLVVFDRRASDPTGVVRVKILCGNDTIALSQSVPVLENFRFRVLEEDAYPLGGGGLGWIHDLSLEVDFPIADFDAFAANAAPAIRAVLCGEQENDVFNQLTPVCGLSAEEANWVRAWFRYLRQVGATYSMQTAADALRRNPVAAKALLAYFRARLRPGGGYCSEADALADLRAAMEDVSGIDDDHVLRLFAALIGAMLRTNAFVDGGPEALAFKFRSGDVPGLPKPHPWCEVWVYSPRVEAIHLRGGPIARGGIRWSDRRDDFRTEVLGLVKAQMVKNAVIVPTGAKGGFYAKQLPDPALDRDGWLAEGQESYRIFIRALLSITDNLDAQGNVVPAAGVARLDGDDSYLVVAADKGTAAFSDTANAIAEQAGFWLGDAFASGGSTGYDHKGMAITARGAWVSVTRHFAELGIDVQSESVTVAGVGDMSGDVFGNGMLRSKALKLVCAFDHRHIFLDPSPDPESAWQERARLYALPRSSWADYDPKLISQGGGVYARSLKSVPLSPEVRALLQIDAEALPPAQLIAAILRAPVDLLWFGGIGTYLKGSEESNSDVGDRANDSYRTNGQDVRARVIGEGANLGVTQAGRIEYALRGGRINTDFIDNSAGVDTSDLEVNIKIALSAAVRSGRLSRDARNGLLKAMTDDAARLVLADNEAQTLVLSVTEANAPARLQLHVKLMEALAQSGRLDVQVEGLPNAHSIAERKRLGLGLMRPELAILLSYTKIELEDALAVSAVVDDALTENDLLSQFPPALQADFAEDLRNHPLRREIIATVLANQLVNRCGLTMAHDIAAEAGCPLENVVAAFVAARALFDLEGLWRAVDSAAVPTRQALQLHGEAAAITRILVGDLVRQDGVESPAALVARLAPGVRRLLAGLDRQDGSAPWPAGDALRNRLADAPQPVLSRLLALAAMSGAVGIVALAADLGLDELATAKAHDDLGRALGLDWAQSAAQALVPHDDWERLLAVDAARRFGTARLDLIGSVTARNGDPVQQSADWLQGNAAAVEALVKAVDSARRTGTPTVAMLAHLANVAKAALAG